MIKKIIYISMVLGLFPVMAFASAEEEAVLREQTISRAEIFDHQDSSPSLQTDSIVNKDVKMSADSPLNITTSFIVNKNEKINVGSPLLISPRGGKHGRSLIFRRKNLIVNKYVKICAGSPLNPQHLLLIKELGKIKIISADVNYSERLACLAKGAGDFCSREEAVWERKALQKIQEKSLVEDLASRNDSEFSVKSFCSAELIDRINSRKAALKIILHTALKDKQITLYDKQLLKQFKKYAQAAINPLTERENELIKEISNSENKKGLSPFDTLTESSNKEQESICTFLFVTTILPVSKNNLNNNKQLKIKAGLKLVCKDIHNVNLNRYSTKMSKADIFRLFLYIWEDNEGAADFNKLYFPSLKPFLTGNLYPVLISLSVRPLNPPEGDFEFLNRNNFSNLDRIEFIAVSCDGIDAGSPLNPPLEGDFCSKVPLQGDLGG